MNRIVLAIAVCLFHSNVAFAGPDEDFIQNLLHGTFDRPESKLSIAPIVVTSDYAIAGWVQGDMGGRALLKKKTDGWSVILCAGGEIRAPQALVRAGIPSQDATRLALELNTAEAQLPAERLALFSRFEGMVMMEEHGKHHH